MDASKANGSGSIRVADAHPATSVCGEPLNDAAYDLGPGEVSTFYDARSGTRIELLATSGGGYTLRVGTSGTVVFADDFETDKGWRAGPDTATAGRWERGDPETTTYNNQTYQHGDTTSGTNDLATGRLAGPDAGTHDVDGGQTTIRSPEITLPPTGTLTLSLQHYLAHANNATSTDSLRVKVVGTTSTTVLERLGAATDRPGAWAPASVNLNQFAGQKVRILVEAADTGTGSLIEAGIDDIRITQS